jgi:two-component system response regulator BasR
MHLLLVEDDLELGTEMLHALVARGFTNEWVRTARAALELVDDADSLFACAVLDLGLPDGEGLDVLKEWRRRGVRLPVIVLTARDALQARVSGLDAGADDYVIKPVEPEELVSRIRAVTRRAGGHTSSLWSVGSLQIDLNVREVRQHDKVVELSRLEFDVVAELARHAGQVVSKHRLVRALAPLGEPMEFNALEVHIHNLRKKMGADSILTVRGVGYRIGL